VDLLSEIGMKLNLDITKAFATDEQYRLSVGVPKSPEISAF
jgi:hypothetical protein